MLKKWSTLLVNILSKSSDFNAFENTIFYRKSGSRFFFHVLQFEERFVYVPFIFWLKNILNVLIPLKSGMATDLNLNVHYKTSDLGPSVIWKSSNTLGNKFPKVKNDKLKCTVLELFRQTLNLKLTSQLLNETILDVQEK